MLNVGDRAPDFSLSSDDGKQVSLAELLGRGPVVLFFYPKDNSPGCTVEAGAFAKVYDNFREAGAEVVGISSDGTASHQRFRQQCGLPYPLVSDDGGAVRKSYGIPKTMGVLPGRATFVIGTDGTVKHAFNSQFSPERHPQEALAALKTDR